MRSSLFIGLVVCTSLISAKQYQYQTADLFEAARVGHKRDVKRYITSGVDVNALDIAGKTALDYAVERNQEKVIRMLVKRRAKVTTLENLKAVQTTFQQYVKRRFLLSVVLFAVASLIFIPSLIAFIIGTGYEALAAFIFLLFPASIVAAPCYFTSWGLGASSLYWQRQGKKVSLLQGNYIDIGSF